MESTTNQLNLNSFFAGIGGFDLGFERAGVGVGLQCEISAFCRSVLGRHWDTSLKFPDITTLSAAELPDADLWAGGFPCQDVSVARGWLGREGLNGKRSGLFHIFLGLIASRLPKVVLLENVTGLLSSHDGLDFELILKGLTDLGYGVSWRVLNSRYFGAPQSRPRVFICAWLKGPLGAIGSLYEDSVSPWPTNERAGFLTPCDRHVTGAIVPEVAYCLAATSGRHTGTDWSRSYVSYYDRVRRLTPSECEGLQGFPKGWTLPDPGTVLAENELDSMRYEALGNAVCVPVVEWIARRIVAAWGTSDAQAPVAVDMLQPFPTDKPKSILYLGDVINSRGKFKWSTGGYAWQGQAVLAAVSPAPLTPVPSYFADILEHESVSEGHFLSPNAAEGILRRVRGQGRTLFQPLEEALDRLSGKRRIEAVKPPIVFPSKESQAAFF